MSDVRSPQQFGGQRALTRDEYYATEQASEPIVSRLPKRTTQMRGQMDRSIVVDRHDPDEPRDYDAHGR